jgi:hypothetical protein
MNFNICSTIKTFVNFIYCKLSLFRYLLEVKKNIANIESSPEYSALFSSQPSAWPTGLNIPDGESDMGESDMIISSEGLESSNNVSSNITSSSTNPPT